MKLSGKTHTKISFVILGISIVVWVILLFNPGHIMTIEHCHVSDGGPSVTSLQMLLDMNPFSSQLIGWGLMVIAMMLPKLIIPIQYIYTRSFKHKRFLSAVIFVLGYMVIWMIVGVFMIILILGLHLLLPNSYIPAFGLLIIAVVWQFSPFKQRCLNRGHNHWTLAAFGWEASRDAFLFGISHGIWCVGSGWALMLFPMVLPRGQNFAMIVVTFIMISEHLEHPRLPNWKLRFRLKLLWFVIAWTKIKLDWVKN